MMTFLSDTVSTCLYTEVYLMDQDGWLLENFRQQAKGIRGLKKYTFHPGAFLVFLYITFTCFSLARDKGTCSLWVVCIAVLKIMRDLLPKKRTDTE